ncbi:hypothetical protein V6N13_089374 [Hibiscus sabdariffa]
MQPLVECSNKLEAFAYIDIDIVHEPRVTREASKGVDALMQNFEVGHNLGSDKKYLWHRLIDLKEIIEDMPWLAGRDFNIIASPEVINTTLEQDIVDFTTCLGCPVELLNEFLGVTFYEEAKQVLQAMVTREEIKASLFAKEFTYY